MRLISRLLNITMPPRRPQRQARPRGYDPTASITAAAGARTHLNSMSEEEVNKGNEGVEMPTEEALNKDPEENANEDLKKLIETLKSKMGINPNSSTQKKSPPQPKTKSIWNRSLSSDKKDWAPKPAYTILTRVSNHEKVPTKSNSISDITLKGVPDSFIYKPGADGIKVDKLNIKAGRQICMG